MSDTMTKPRTLGAREKEADIAARAAIAGADLHLSGDWATNTYWAVPRRNVEIVLERAGLEVTDGRYHVDGPGKVTKVRDDAPDVARLFPAAGAELLELSPVMVPGTSTPMMADRGNGPLNIYSRDEGGRDLVALNAAFLSWILGDALPMSSSFYAPARHIGYRLEQDPEKPAGPVLITTTTTYGAEHRHLLMPVRLG